MHEGFLMVINVGVYEEDALIVPGKGEFQIPLLLESLEAFHPGPPGREVMEQPVSGVKALVEISHLLYKFFSDDHKHPGLLDIRDPVNK